MEPANTHFPLCKLPDQLITRIFHFLCDQTPDAPGALHLRSLHQARHAFSLARCSRALLHIFRTSCLRSIDASLPPHLLFSDRQFFYPLTVYQCPNHLQSLLWLSGRTLRLLRLPTFRPFLEKQIPAIEAVFAAIADFCPNIISLSFHEDTRKTDPIFMHAAFKAIAPRLINLQVYRLQKRTLSTLASIENFLPRDLRFHNMSVDLTQPLLRFLRRRGRFLTTLHIGFCEAHRFFPVLDAFVDAMVRAVQENLPNLKILHYSEPEEPLFEPRSHFYDYSSRDFPFFLQKMTDIAQFVHRNINHNHVLTDLQVTGSERAIRYSLTAFSRFCTEQTKVLVDFKAAVLAWPATHTNNLYPYDVRTIRNIHVTKLLFDISPTLLGNIEQVEIEGNDCSRFHCFSTDDISIITRSCQNSRASLKVVRAFVDVCSWARFENLCGVLSDALLCARNVTCLHIPLEVANYLAQGSAELSSVLQNLGNLKSLVLGDENCRSEFTREFQKPVVENLPLLLELIFEFCPMLESLSIQDKFWKSASSHCSRRKIRHALNCLRSLEKKHPKLDAGTVHVWLNRLLDISI